MARECDVRQGGGRREVGRGLEGARTWVAWRAGRYPLQSGRVWGAGRSCASQRICSLGHSSRNCCYTSSCFCHIHIAAVAASACEVRS